MSKEVGEMVRSRDVVQAEGSARTEGARRATGVRARRGGRGGLAGAGARWSGSRKRDVVLRLLSPKRSTGSTRGGSGPWLASSSA